MLGLLKVIIVLSFLLVLLLNLYVILKIYMIKRKEKETEHYIEVARKIIKKENKK